MCKLRQGTGSGGDCLIDNFIRMSCRQKSGFKLGWGNVNPIFQHRLEETRIYFPIAYFYGLPIVNRILTEEVCKHRAHASLLDWNACLVSSASDSINKLHG